MNDYIRQELEGKDPVSKEAMKYIRKVGIKTGSYVFGGYSEDKSDIDILIHPDSGINFNDMLDDNLGCYEMHDYREEDFESIYVKDNKGIIYNLLIMYSSEGFNKWRTATRIMKTIVTNSNTAARHIKKSKGKRVAFFEAIKTLIE